MSDMWAARSLPRCAPPRGARVSLSTDRLAQWTHRRLSAKEPGRRHASMRRGHAGFGGPTMKEIVLVTLAVDTETGRIDPKAPFMVNSSRRGPRYNRPYEDEPSVIEQFRAS